MQIDNEHCNANLHDEETLVLKDETESEASAPTCISHCRGSVHDACIACIHAQCCFYALREKGIRSLLSSCDNTQIVDEHPELVGAMVKASMRISKWDLSRYTHISLEQAGRGAQGSTYKMVLYRSDGHFHSFLVKGLNKPRSHPHPVHGHTLGSRHVRVFVAPDRSELQQWVPGITLEQLYAWLTKVNLTHLQGLSTKLFAALQCLRALEPICSEGIAHNDLKPSNIMCNHRGKIVIIDPGCERSADSDAEFIEGTPSFADPARCDHPSGATHSDVFSVGQMLTQIFSHDGKTLNDRFLHEYCAYPPGDAFSLLTNSSSYATVHYKEFCHDFLREGAATQQNDMQGIQKELAAVKQLAIDMVDLSPEKRPTLQHCIERLQQQMQRIQSVDPGCTHVRLAALSIMGGITDDHTSHFHLRGSKGIVTIDQEGALKCAPRKSQGVVDITDQARTFTLDQTVGNDRNKTLGDIQNICGLSDASMNRIAEIMHAFVSLRCNIASDGMPSLCSVADTQVASSPMYSARGWKSFLRSVWALLQRKWWKRA